MPNFPSFFPLVTSPLLPYPRTHAHMSKKFTVSNFELTNSFFPRSLPHFKNMLQRSLTFHRAIAPKCTNLLVFRPTIYISHRASASSAAQTEPTTSRSNPEHTFTTINIRQCTKTFRGNQWTVLSIPKDGDNITKCLQNEYSGDQRLTLKQSILLTRDNILSTFLPRGYPHSVTPEYRGFAYWQMWHNMAGSVTSGKAFHRREKKIIDALAPQTLTCTCYIRTKYKQFYLCNPCFTLSDWELAPFP